MASRATTREQDERTLQGLALRRKGVSWRDIDRTVGIAGFANQHRRIVEDDVAAEPSAAAYWGRK